METIKDIADYQKEVDRTAVYEKGNLMRELSYLSLGLNGEAGEVADKVKKVIRDSDGHLSLEMRNEIAKELGDVLWYLTQFSSAIGSSIEEIATINIQKVRKRNENGTLHGSGDNR